MNSSVCVSERHTARWVPKGRTLHLVDVENLCGGSHVDEDAVSDAMQAYREVIALEPLDHMVVACSPQLAIPVHDAAPEARILVGRGFDGADRELIGAADTADVIRRFDGVVVASGDHIFTTLAASLRLAGVSVTVVSRESSLSASLARAALTVVCLSDVPESIGEAALRRVA